MPCDDAPLQDEIPGALDHLEREEDRRHRLDAQITPLTATLAPQGWLPSLPGRGDLLTAGIRPCLGDIDRFDSLANHKGSAGFSPASTSTGDHRVKRVPISTMRSKRSKPDLSLAAEHADTWDGEMAAFSHQRRQADHCPTQAVWAVAHTKLLPSIHHPMTQLKQAEITHTPRPHDVFRDLSGHPISTHEARTLIQAPWGNTSSS
jgi:hypothetical protein